MLNPFLFLCFLFRLSSPSCLGFTFLEHFVTLFFDWLYITNIVGTESVCLYCTSSYLLSITMSSVCVSPSINLTALRGGPWPSDGLHCARIRLLMWRRPPVLIIIIIIILILILFKAYCNSQLALPRAYTL